MVQSETVVSITGLTKSFGPVRALDGLDLEIPRGITGIIGPNGAGKTTLLRILLGLLKPDSGTATVLGLNVTKDSLEIRSRVGVLHERPALPKTITGRQFLEMAGRLYREKKPAEKLLDLVNLTDAADRRIGTYSAGMYQRLGIAHALVGNPEIVFLDEPTANLDVIGRDDIVSILTELYDEQGVSFFISSHIMSEVERSCHSIAFIKRGKHVSSGETRETIAKHTADHLRIVTSNARELLRAIESLEGIQFPKVVGTNTITAGFASDSIEASKAEVQRIAKDLGITVYAFENADSLEDAFREVMRDE
ncbi:MAG: ABC transporter ATP-binding protein [Candidatus Thorarchaeota archaeon]